MLMLSLEQKGYTQGEITGLPLVDRAKSQSARESLAQEGFDPRAVVLENAEILSRLGETPFKIIGQKLAKGEDLGFENAFLGMTYVVGATNKGIFNEIRHDIQNAHGLNDLRQQELRGPGQTFLTAMAQKESAGTLTAEEIAGMAAAGMMDINLRLGFSPYVLETGGMGGDKGFVINGAKMKVINASTLAAITLAALGIPVLKHGSYANASAVGSTDAVEALGVNIYQSKFDDIERLFNNTNFYFSDAHIAKTIHDLSHSPFLRHETINHIIGPMTPPVDRKTKLNKIIGVNEGVHPALIAQAYQILHEKGYQNVGNVLVVSGLSENFEGSGVDINDRGAMKPYMMLDEASPHSTLLAVVQNGINKGSFIVRPEDFGAHIPVEDVQFVNSRQALLEANGRALNGLSGANSDYLAMNASLGLLAAEYLEDESAILNGELNSGYLQEAFTRCREVLDSGTAATHLKKIVEYSHG